MSEAAIILLLGWLGCGFAIFGRAAVAYKIRIGFLAAILSGAVLGIQAIMMYNPGMLTLCVVLGVIDLLGWFHWGRKNERKNTPG